MKLRLLALTLVSALLASSCTPTVDVTTTDPVTGRKTETKTTGTVDPAAIKAATDAAVAVADEIATIKKAQAAK